jgi:hypothetical protein
MVLNSASFMARVAFSHILPGSTGKEQWIDIARQSWETQPTSILNSQMSARKRKKNPT